MKSNLGESINERADTLAEEGRQISDDNKWWDVRTDHMTFEVQKGNMTVRSVWTNSVRNTFPRQAGWARWKFQELQEARLCENNLLSPNFWAQKYVGVRILGVYCRRSFGNPQTRIMMVEEINKRLATSEGSAIVTLEPSDFPRLCRVPHMLKDWRIQLPRSSIGAAPA